jgi:hypothetical protein
MKTNALHTHSVLTIESDLRDNETAAEFNRRARPAKQSLVRRVLRSGS